MNKGKSTWKYNKLLTARRNMFNLGGDIKNFFGKESFSLNPFKLSEDLMLLSNFINAGASAIGGIGGSLIGGGYLSGAGNVVSGLSTVASAIPGPFGTIASVGLGLAGGAINRLAGTKLNLENIKSVENNITSLNAFSSNAKDYDSLASNWASSPAAMGFNDDFIGKNSLLNHGASKKAKALRERVRLGKQWVDSSLENNALNIRESLALELAANFRAFGGELNTLGGDFTTGLIHIDLGGTHEANPYGGVIMGIDPEGTPNTVELGEVVYNDYVFSNRMKVPKSIKDKLKVKGDKPFTFAEIVKELSKESEERPNDPISKNGLEAGLAVLMNSLELLRQKKEAKQVALESKNENRFEDGGQEWQLVDSKGNITPINEEAYLGFLADTEKYLDLGNIYTYNNGKKLFRVREVNKPDLPKVSNPLMWAPVAGSALGAITSLFDKPDEKLAKSVEAAAANAAKNYQRVAYKPIGDYLAYKPMDRLGLLNAVNTSAGATRRNIMNTSGGNRATAMAGLLAADYNTMNSIGSSLMEMDKYNAEQEQKVAEFNRATNMTNSEGLFRADTANQGVASSMADMVFRGGVTAAELRQLARQRVKDGLSANLTGLFDNLGQLGKLLVINEQTNWYNKYGGAAPENRSSYGGKINRRKGLTY